MDAEWGVLEKRGKRERERESARVVRDCCSLAPSLPPPLGNSGNGNCSLGNLSIDGSLPPSERSAAAAIKYSRDPRSPARSLLPRW